MIVPFAVPKILSHALPVSVLFSCLLVAPPAQRCFAQENPATNVPSPSSSTTPEGAQLFAQHCVTCHAADLKGAGPFPPPYRTPPDLTTLAKRHGGKFPEAYVVNVIRNGVKLPAHGPAEMPVWGSDFASTDKLDKAQVSARIKALAGYLKSQQAK